MPFYGEEEQIFQRSIQKFIEKEIHPELTNWEEEGFFPSELFSKLAAEGYLGILIDEKYGGISGDLKLAAAWVEAFGKTASLGLTIAVNMHSLVITPAIQKFGSDYLKDKFLKGAVEGKLIGAYAFTEPEAGSDLSNIKTNAKKSGENWILNGSKIFITNGKRADFVIVLAKTNAELGYKGYSSFVVEKGMPGFNVSRTLDKYGWLCSDTAELSFEDVEIPGENLLGEEGAGWSQSMSSLEWERLMLSLNSLSGAKECLKQTEVYCKDRKLFKKTLYDFDLTQHFFSEMKSELFAAEKSSHRSLSMLLAEKNCRKEVSLNKLFVTELAIKIADRCLQLHGGYGYTKEFLPERWLRDLRLNTIGGGTSEIMGRIWGREVFGR